MDETFNAFEEPVAVRAQRFAENAVALYQGKGAFSVSAEPDELDALVAAFLALGCSVLADRVKNRLAIDCPGPDRAADAAPPNE